MTSDEQRTNLEPAEELFLAALEQFEQGGYEAVEPLLADQPEHAARILARLEMLAGAGLLDTVSMKSDSFPESLGEFKLRERLGSGGMGVVFLAEQPSLRREVALKLIRPDQLFFPKARERFQREVEVVAGLQHGGVVPVYMAGEDQGIPYFAMERVHGVSLARLLAALGRYEPSQLDERALAETLLELRLEAGDEEGADYELRGASWVAICVRWMLELAEVLEYAHSRGVLHRDIKPPNVMLTWDGQVRVLDFGLASSRGGSKLTRTGSQLGSLPYMSPEQLGRDAKLVDERSDVYGVGVTLYELLTLRSPYYDPERGELETRARIVEAAPTAIRELNAAVPRDAETVCLTAMDPSPERRYASAEGLARDLRNVLELRPIAARRAGTALRVRRWTQRHPAWTVGAVLGTLLFVVGPTAFAVRERYASKALERERAKVELEVEIKEATLRFLTEDLLAAVQPEEVGKDASMRQVLDVASERIEGRFLEQPLVEAALRVTIGDTYRKLGLAEPATLHLERAVALHLDQGGSESRESLDAVAKLASLYTLAERDQEAIELHRRNLAVRRGLLGDDDPDTLASANNLGLALAGRGRYEESERLLAEVYERRLRLLPPDHRDLLITMNNLGVLYANWGRLEQAIEWAETELAACERSLGPDHPDTAVSLRNTGNLYLDAGREREGVEMFERAVQISEEQLGLEHPRTIETLTALLFDRVFRKRFEDCERLLLKLDAATAALGPRSRAVIDIRTVRTNIARHQGRLDEAMEMASELLDDCIEEFGHADSRTVNLMTLLGILLQADGDLEGAAMVLAEAAEFSSEVQRGVPMGEKHLAYGSCLHALGRYEEAEEVLTHAFQVLDESSPNHSFTMTAANELARLSRAREEEDQAIEWSEIEASIRANRLKLAGSDEAE